MDRHKLYYTGSISVIALLIIGIIIFALMSVYEPPQLNYENNPFPTKKATYAPGEKVIFDFVRCSKGEIPYTFTITLVDVTTHKKVYLPGTTIVADKGCYDLTSTPKKLPEDLPEGTYKFKFGVIYKGNFRNHFITGLETTEFKVVRATE